MRCYALLTVIAAALTPVANAGQITGFTWTSGIASVAGVIISPPMDPNNDNVAGPSPNEIRILQKDYTGIGPIDIEFTVIPSGGVTEYSFIEGVQNSTGIDWASYCMQLGFGTGTDFVPSAAGDGLDFDAPDYDSPFAFDPSGGGPFPTVVVTEDLVAASGGIQGGFEYAEPFVFTIDVPDGITSFTLRQLPKAVPEPNTALLGAVAALLARRRPHRHQS
ncbi:MAG: choice-of-anchor F family protein [Planctomycetota bacterium]